MISNAPLRCEVVTALAAIAISRMTALTMEKESRPQLWQSTYAKYIQDRPVIAWPMKNRRRVAATSIVAGVGPFDPLRIPGEPEIAGQREHAPDRQGQAEAGIGADGSHRNHKNGDRRSAADDCVGMQAQEFAVKDRAAGLLGQFFAGLADGARDIAVAMRLAAVDDEFIVGRWSF